MVAPDPLQKLTFVLGGAASGKSAYAENLVTRSGRPRIYVATAQAFDAEMKQKISAHRAARGPEWETVEAPLDPASVLRGADAKKIVLLDCVTLWLSNLLLEDRPVEPAGEDLLEALSDCAAPVVVVSNETGQGIVPESALARRFRSHQGRLNQRIAARADRVVAVMAGLPLALKGDLP